MTAHSVAQVVSVIPNIKFAPFQLSTRHPVLHHSESPRHFRTEQEVGAQAQTRPLAGVSLAESHWFDKPFKGECRAPEVWKVVRFVFLKKPNAKFEKELRGCRAIALLSVFSKWYATVLVDLLLEEKEPIEWKNLRVGSRERGQL